MVINRVLDLDLDFFLSPFEACSADPRRANSDEFTPWTEDAVRDFLETRCLLSKTAPKPGRVIVEHIDAFYCWRDLIANGSLQKPFALVHVDAHADLGCGDACYKYLHGTLLHLPPDERTNPMTRFGGMHSGNFISFALACQWFSSVDFIFNKETPFFDQFPEWAFLDNDFTTEILALKKVAPESISGFGQPRVVGVEPGIPCGFHREDGYQATQEFDFVILAQSPGYTPETSDMLIPVIREYFTDV